MKRIMSLSIGDAELEVQGRWVEKDLTVCTNRVMTSTLTYDLSNYLPKDDYVYEIQVHAWFENRCRVLLGTDVAGGTWLNLIYDFANANNTVGTTGGNLTIPVGKQRKLYVDGQTDQTGKLGGLYIKRYRRLYKDN